MKYFATFLLTLAFISCQQKSETVNHPLFWGFALDGYPITVKQIESLEKETHIKAHVTEFFKDWTNAEKPYESLQPTLEAIWSQGMIPCFTWEPKKNQDAVPYEEILNGTYDSYIHSAAEDIKSWGKPLIIRFAHEMNLSIYHWGTDLKGYGPQSPEIYKKMFRYIADIYRKTNVTNVHWAFCPNVDSIPNESWNLAVNYYPGDEYVHILGMDSYNWDIADEEKQMPWRSFEEIFSSLYKQLKAISSDKPVVVFETASVGRPGSQPQVIWVQDAIAVAHKWNLAGIIWFQVNKEENWRLGPLSETYQFSQSSFLLD